jgi:hypothetical protein
MKLADASSYFDRTPALDTVTGLSLFLGQIGPYDDSKRDASAAYRRILSVRPGTSMPASMVVSMLGRTWMIGAMEPDGLEELYREKYVLQQAAGQLKVSRLSGFLSSTVAATYWASANWVKDAKQLEVSSETPQIFDITMPGSSDVRVHDVVWNTGVAYLVLSPRLVASGYVQVNCLKLEQTAPVVASMTTRTYAPTTGAYTSAAPANVNALLVRWQSLFEYGSQTSERYQEGDAAIVLPSGTVASTSTKITVSSIAYQVLSVLDIDGAVVLHARKV